MTIVIIILAIILIIALFLVGTYNSLVGKRNQITNAEGSINVMLKKRFDLIPNLVKIAKAYMDYEKSLLEKITEIRSVYDRAMTTEDKMEANKNLSDIMTKFYAVAENYPQLKADGAFINLQNSLNEVEEQLSASRRFYNSAVTDYNNTVLMFPSNLVAGIMGFKERQVFQIDENEKSIDIDFSKYPVNND